LYKVVIAIAIAIAVFQIRVVVLVFKIAVENCSTKSLFSLLLLFAFVVEVYRQIICKGNTCLNFQGFSRHKRYAFYSNSSLTITAFWVYCNCYYLTIKLLIMTKQQFIQLEIEKEIALEMQQMYQYERLRDFLDQSTTSDSLTTFRKVNWIST
jgi:hypothetical protein